MPHQSTEFLNVYVPSAEGRAYLSQMLPAGTAIVSAVSIGDTEAEAVLCYYEGNVYGSEDMATFSQRAFFAASRLEHAYPTVAKSLFETKWLTHVGVMAKRPEYTAQQLIGMPPHLRQRIGGRELWTFTPSGEGLEDYAAWVAE